MGKTIIDAKRGETTFMVWPEDVLLVGPDTGHKQGEHPLWQQRAYREPKEASVANLVVNGAKYLPPIVIELSDEAEKQLVADGRGRVIDAREANRRRRERGLEPFQIRALVKRFEDYATSVERKTVSNAFATELSAMDRIFDLAHAIDGGVPEERVALNAGIEVETARRWYRLAKASPDIHAKVESGEWSIATALSVAMKAPAQQKKMLAAGGESGKRQTRRELDKASGKSIPPTRKQLRSHIAIAEKRRAELAEKGETQPLLDATLAALRFAYEGGEPPAVLLKIVNAPAKAKRARRAKPPVEVEASPAPDIDDAIVEHGLTDVATKLFDPMEPELETVSTRMESAGFQIPEQELSRRCLEMLKAGRIARGPGGYRRQRGEG